MANSRLEKIGNIFTRVNGLLKSGAMKVEDKPLFFDIYKAFPPLKEPKFCSPVDSQLKIRQIFYAEDKERASRDESNSLYNLNETVAKRSEPFTYQRPQQTAPETQEKQPKLFDMSELTDLKK